MSTQASGILVKPGATEDIMRKSKYCDNDVLVHSSQPLRLVSEPYLKDLKQNFSFHMRTEHKIALSHVINGGSLIVCTPDDEDPNLYYLPALIKIVINEKMIESDNSHFGPIAIIVVPTERHSQHVSRLCESFQGTEFSKKDGFIFAIETDDHRKVAAKLKNGCGILVTTLVYLNLLLHLAAEENLIDKSRLKHVVITDLTVMSSFNKSMFLENVYTLIREYLIEVDNETLGPQVIVTSPAYISQIVPTMILRSKRPIVLIKDFIEAAIYGGINYTIRMNNKSGETKKESLVLELEKLENPKNQRTVVFCKNYDDVFEVKNLLNENGIEVLNDKSEEEVANWKLNSSRKILVLADKNFKWFKINQADNLIHYSYPTYWHTFKSRHSVLVGNYENMTNKDFCTDDQTQQNVVALINEHDMIQLQLLIQLFMRQQKEIQPEVYEQVKYLLSEYNLNCARKHFTTCSDLAIYGSCTTLGCAYRHRFGMHDFLTIEQHHFIPTFGCVSFQILEVISGTHFVVRLLEHKRGNDDQFRKLLSYNKLSKLLENINPAKYLVPQLGEICLAKVGSYYKRIRIVMIPKLNDMATMLCGQIIDENVKIQQFKRSELFVCPLDIQIIPPLVLHFYLSEIIPNPDIPLDVEQVKSWLCLENQWNGQVRYEANIVRSSVHTIFASNFWIFTKGKDEKNLKDFFFLKGCGRFDSEYAHRIHRIFFSSLYKYITYI